MLCTGSYPRSTPTFGLEIILDILAKLETSKAAARIQGRNPPKWDGVGDRRRRGHLFHFDRDWGDLDRKSTTYHWNNRPTVDWESFHDSNPDIHEGTVCYTDRSQMELENGSLSDVGFGFVIQTTDGSTMKIWGNIRKAIVFQGEAYAIHMAAETVSYTHLTLPTNREV